MSTHLIRFVVSAQPPVPPNKKITSQEISKIVENALVEAGLQPTVSRVEELMSDG